MSPATFLAVQILITATGVAAALSVLHRATRWSDDRRVTFLRLAWAGVWTVCGSGAVTILARPVGISSFGVIRMLYLSGVVGVPTVVLVVVAMRMLGRWRPTRAALALTAVGIGLAPLGVYMTFVAPYELTVERETHVLDPARGGTDPIRVGILADLQCNGVGAHEVAAVDALLAEEPDLILVPGDLFQPHLDARGEWEACRDELLALLDRVRAPHGVYFVIGDVDAPHIVDAVQRHTGWRVLRDETVSVRVGDRDVRIAGTTRRGAIPVGNAFEGAPGSGDVRILMSHAPDTILGLEGRPRADLIVAGHTHGGQVVIPGLGPPMTLSGVPRDMARGGLHTHLGRTIYVSRGVGLERNQAPPMRLFCVPEVTVITLASAPNGRP